MRSFSLGSQVDKATVVLSTRLVSCRHLGCALEIAEARVIILGLLRLRLLVARVELGHLHACKHVTGRLLILKSTLSCKALGLISGLSIRLLAARIKAGLPLLLWSLLLLSIHRLILLHRTVEELWLESSTQAWLLCLLGHPTKRIRLNLGLIWHLALASTVPVSHHLKGCIFRIGWICLWVLTHHLHNVAYLLLLELLLIWHALNAVSTNEVRKSVIFGMLLLDWNS